MDSPCIYLCFKSIFAPLYSRRKRKNSIKVKFLNLFDSQKTPAAVLCVYIAVKQPTRPWVVKNHLCKCFLRIFSLPLYYCVFIYIYTYIHSMKWNPCGFHRICGQGLIFTALFSIYCVAHPLYIYRIYIRNGGNFCTSPTGFYVQCELNK